MPFSLSFGAVALGACSLATSLLGKLFTPTWRKWRHDGTWERLHTALRERVRIRAGRKAQPSAAIIDSQSVKTTSLTVVQ